MDSDKVNSSSKSKRQMTDFSSSYRQRLRRAHAHCSHNSHISRPCQPHVSIHHFLLRQQLRIKASQGWKHFFIDCNNLFCVNILDRDKIIILGTINACLHCKIVVSGRCFCTLVQNANQMGTGTV